MKKRIATSKKINHTKCLYSDLYIMLLKPLHPASKKWSNHWQSTELQEKKRIIRMMEIVIYIEECKKAIEECKKAKKTVHAVGFSSL